MHGFNGRGIPVSTVPKSHSISPLPPIRSMIWSFHASLQRQFCTLPSDVRSASASNQHPNRDRCVSCGKNHRQGVFISLFWPIGQQHNPLPDRFDSFSMAGPRQGRIARDRFCPAIRCRRFVMQLDGSQGFVDPHPAEDSGSTRNSAYPRVHWAPTATSTLPSPSMSGAMQTLSKTDRSSVSTNRFNPDSGTRQTPFCLPTEDPVFHRHPHPRDPVTDLHLVIDRLRNNLQGALSSRMGKHTLKPTEVIHRGDWITWSPPGNREYRISSFHG